MGKLTSLVGKFSTRGKEKQGAAAELGERQESSPRKEPQSAAEAQQRGSSDHRKRNGRQGASPELSEESDRGGGSHHDIAAFGSDVSGEFRPNKYTHSGELDGLVVTRPAFQSMVFQRPKNDAKVCGSCRKEADPRHPGSLFTAECRHTFHFECIALGLDLGHLRCPLCRKTWRRLPDNGAWANGALGFTYQGQPVRGRNGAPRPPRNVRQSAPPLPSNEEDDSDLDDIPIAPVVEHAHGASLSASPERALERPPTFNDSWAKRRPSEELNADLEADPFDFHQKSPQKSPPPLDDMPSPVALKRGGDFALRKGGAAEPDFEFSMSSGSLPPEAESPKSGNSANGPPHLPPPTFTRRRRTSKDSQLPSIIEALSPDGKSKVPPSRRTPPVSPRRRYERRQAAGLDVNSDSPRSAGKANVSPSEENRRPPSAGGAARVAGLKPPPGRGNLTPPPGGIARPKAGKQEDQDWAKFFAPSTKFDVKRADARNLPPTSSGECGVENAEEKFARGVRPQLPAGAQPQGFPAPLLMLTPEDPRFASYAKGLRVLGVISDYEENLGTPIESRAGSGGNTPEVSPAEEPGTSRGFAAPRSAEQRLESLRVSVPPVDGTWSSMEGSERDIRVDTNSKIVYSSTQDRSEDLGRPSDHSADLGHPSHRAGRLADTQGWFLNSEVGNDGISEMLHKVEMKRGENKPEVWDQSAGHNHAGSLQDDANFDIERFEAAIGPELFDDDDPVAPLQPLPGNAPDLEISVKSEYPAVPAGEARDKLLCLVTVKAPPLVKPSTSSPEASSRSGGASSHHARKSSDGSLNGSRRRGSLEAEDLRGLGVSDRRRSELQRASSADVALLGRRDSADLDGWLTEQLTERLQLQNSACPDDPDAPLVADASVPPVLEEARAPLDLVAVLDVSKSMMGRKLRLVQKTIHFVTQNLGPNDRLSVVAFAKKAYRVTPLLRMTEAGRERTTAAVKRIEVSSGTNIGAGLRTGLKVLKEARTRNPVRAVVLLSDGQDSWGRREMSMLLPEWGLNDWHGIAVHTFGFGGDHDAEAMFSVASEARGTYSFIKRTEGVQDAFARCIGGLLTVVAQDVTLSLEMGEGNRGGNGCRIQHLHAGMFERTVDEAGTQAVIALGDIYAEEERDILLELSVSRFEGRANGRQLVLRASGSYLQARTQLIKVVSPAELLISRPLQLSFGGTQADLVVDRQRNRLLATRAMATAREWAELGQLGAAQKMLENAVAQIGKSAAFANGDPLTLQLDHDLRECAAGFGSVEEYEERGRAFSMSQGLSHAMQRASTSTSKRGSSQTGFSGGYSTSTMEFMINRSQCFEVKR